MCRLAENYKPIRHSHPSSPHLLCSNPKAREESENQDDMRRFQSREWRILFKH